MGHVCSELELKVQPSHCCPEIPAMVVRDSELGLKMGGRAVVAWDPALCEPK